MSRLENLPLILKRSDLIRNISILASGTTIAQLIPILLQPLLRRHYSPEEFGAYAVYISISGILIIIASMKYELAIILPEKDKEATNILALAVLINLSFSLVIFFSILFYRKPILNLVNIPEDFAVYLYFVPLGVFLYSLYQSINYWLIRKKLFFSVSLNKFIRRGFEGGNQAAFMFSNMHGGLLFGDIIGHVTNNISGITQAIRNEFKLRNIRTNKLKYVLKKYIEYPKFNVIPSFMSASSYLLPAILINKYFSSEYTGYFDLSKLMLSIPLALIATSISNVLLQLVSERFRKSESFLYELLLIMALVIFIGILEIIIIRIWGVSLFRIFFGNEWILSGKLSRILVWSFAFNFIIASFTSLFISMKKIRLLSAWQFLYFLGILSLTLFKDLPFIEFIKTYVIIEISFYSIIALMILVMIWKYEKKILKTNVRL